MLKEFFLPPLLACKKQLALLFFSLLIITLMQAMFLLLTGPVLTLLFSEPNASLPLAQLSPLAARLLPDISFPRTFFLLWLPVLLALTGMLKSACAYLFRYCQNYISLWMAKHLRQELCAAIIAPALHVFFAQARGTLDVHYYERHVLTTNTFLRHHDLCLSEMPRKSALASSS